MNAEQQEIETQPEETKDEQPEEKPAAEEERVDARPPEPPPIETQQMVRAPEKLVEGITNPMAALRSGREWAAQMVQFKALIGSHILPKHIKTPEQAMVIAMYGDQLGVPLMVALNSIYVVEGKPELSGELTAAIIRRDCPSGQIKIIERSAKRCHLKARRGPSDEWVDIEWTIEDAKTAGLLGKDNWKKYPTDMLYWRCMSRVRRLVFPDIATGFAVEGELRDAIDVVATERSIDTESRSKLGDLLG